MAVTQVTGGTATLNLPKTQNVKLTPKEKCEAKGWVWNAKTQTCTPPSTKGADTTTEPPKVFSDTLKENVIKPQPGSGKWLDNVEVSPEDYKNELERARMEAGGGHKARTEEELIAAGLKIDPTAEATEIERQELLANEPVRRELDPTVIGLEEIPVVGPLFKELLDKIPGFKKRSGTDILTPEELRTEALTTIERIEIEKGLTKSEKFGRLAEAVPAGELAKWIPGLSGAEKPSGNVQTIVSSLKQLKTRARDIVSNAETGDLSRSQAEERIRVIEEELQEGESRIRLLIQNSPELKFNSDGVNFIEGKILETRIILQDARLAALNAPTRPSRMTDGKIYQTLNSFEDEDFDIPGL